MKNWTPPKRRRHTKTTARTFNIPAVVYDSIGYQSGINDTTRKNTLFLFILLYRGSVIITGGLHYPIQKIDH
jgi:hypothetical protein